MKQILVYGDSVSWGIVPTTRQRLPFEARWPGVLEGALKADGHAVRIVENCLNGRRTVFEDPYNQGRNGLLGLAQTIEMHAPLALVIVMLGTNDVQSMHPHSAWHAAQGVAVLVKAIREAPIEPGMPVADILVIAPPPIREAKGAIAPKFVGAASKSVGLAEAYKAVADELGCRFLDAGGVTPASRVDGVHLDADQHALLGNAVRDAVRPLLGDA